MLKSRLLGSVICVYLALSAGASPSRAAGCEDTIARHMVGEAMLAAQDFSGRSVAAGGRDSPRLVQ